MSIDILYIADAANSKKTNISGTKDYQPRENLLNEKMLAELSKNLNNPNCSLEDLFKDNELYNFFVKNYNSKTNSGEYIIPSTIIDKFKTIVKNFLMVNYPNLKLNNVFKISSNGTIFIIEGANFNSGIDQSLENVAIVNENGKIKAKKIPNSPGASFILADKAEVDRALEIHITNENSIGIIKENCYYIITEMPHLIKKVLEVLSNKIELERKKGNLDFVRELEGLRSELLEKQNNNS